MPPASVTRRELLSALIGAPLAVAACRREPRAYPGRIAGVRMVLGHRLREATVERVTGPAERVGVVIVGAGPSGLSAARRLEQLGLRDYRVLDLEPKSGGTSAYGDDAVVPYPWGAHYVPLPRQDQPLLLELLTELGAVERAADGSFAAAENARIRAPEERLFLDSSWEEGLFPSSRASADDQHELRRFEQKIAELVAFRDALGRRAFTLPVRACSDAAEITALDRLSAAAWLRQHGFRSKLLGWYIEYACRDDYGLSLERTSAWAMLFYFCARVATPGGQSAPFLSWPEGNGRIVRHLTAAVGDRLRLNQLVTDVVPGAESVELVAVDATDERAARYVADAVILAVPKFVARRILRPYREAPPAHLDAFRYGAWLVANLHLRGRPRSRGFPLAWDNVLFDSPSLGYVVASHQALSDLGPTVWTYYRPFSELEPERARALLGELDHRTAVEAVVTDLSRAHQGLEALIERVDVYRWGHAMVLPSPGFVWGGARARAEAPLGRVVFAHADLSGMALFEEAFDRGVAAAEIVAARRGAGPPAPHG